MPTTFDVAGHSRINGAAAATWTHVVASQSALLLICWVGTLGDQDVSSAPTYNGVSMTLLDSTASGAGTTDRKIKLYYLLNPATGSNTMSVTLNAGANSRGQATSVSFYSVDQSTPFGTVTKTAATTGTSFSLTPASTTDDIVVDAGEIRTGSTPATANGQTVDFNDTFNSNVTHAASHLAGSAGTTTVGWTWTGSDRNAYLAVAVKFGVSSRITLPLVGVGR